MTRTIAVTPEAMRELARTVADCAQAAGHAVAAVRSAPRLDSGTDVAGALAIFQAAASTVLAVVGDDASSCAHKVTAAADSWVVLDRHAAIAAGRRAAGPPSAS